MTKTRAKTEEEALTVPQICLELQRLQRMRSRAMKSRNRIANCMRADVANTLGYNSRMEEHDRDKYWDEAKELIEAIRDGKVVGNFMEDAVLASTVAVDGYQKLLDSLERKMKKLADQLPVAAWCKRPEQRGFGTTTRLSLAIIIGETGDLSNYSTVSKVWRRMGLAPWTYNGKTAMGSTWKGNGGLPAKEWEGFGYNPRRRCVAYLIGESLIKANTNGHAADETPVETEATSVSRKRRKGAHKTVDDTEAADVPGPYRRCYDEAKAAKAKLPDWTRCPKCLGTRKTGKTGKAKCQNCKGTGKVMKRCHLHGMLLATKLLILNLWVEWNKGRRKGERTHVDVGGVASSSVPNGPASRPLRSQNAMPGPKHRNGRAAIHPVKPNGVLPPSKTSGPAVASVRAKTKLPGLKMKRRRVAS